jgi:two-component sensor histidine kinase
MAMVRLELDLKPVMLSVNAAVPCGFILNELFTILFER